MTAAPATSLATLLLPASAAAGRTLSNDDPKSDGQAWQRALDSAAQDGPPATAATAQASYLLALSHLGVAPAAIVRAPALALPVARVPETPDSPAATSTAPSGGAPPRDARPTIVADAIRRPPPPPDAHDTDRVVTAEALAGPAEPAGLARTAVAQRGTHASLASEREAADPATPRDVPMTLPALQPSCTQAILGYAATMASAPVPIDRPTEFELASGSTPLPVRVHVQWRGRVADVWIGLHRAAFDRLPDIRDGIDDWVHARGGALGRVVCNGEALAPAPHSFQFQGAL